MKTFQVLIQQAALCNLIVGLALAAEPTGLDLGTVTPGQIVPRIVSGGGEWSTEFQIFNLDRSGEAYEVGLLFADAASMTGSHLFDSLELDLLDSDGQPLGPTDSFATMLPSKGTVIVRTSSEGPLKAGFAVLAVRDEDAFGPPGLREVAVSAVITRVAQGADFRTSVPAVPFFQERTRLPFFYRDGFVTCLAVTSFARELQNVTYTARDAAGLELCSDSSLLVGARHEAFCLADRLPCVTDTAGSVEIFADSGGVVAVGLSADPTFRLWTSFPYEIVGAGEQCLGFPEERTAFANLHDVSDTLTEVTGFRSTDRLVSGKPDSEVLAALTNMIIPLPAFPDQRFCGLIELVPGFPADLYVPTAAERAGDFSAYNRAVIDPLTEEPFPGNAVPDERLGEVFAWRIRSPSR